MADNSHGSEEHSDDSFEAWLRQAAHASHVSPRSLLPSGTKLASGRFEITRRIGEGGMGVVYEAFDAERRCNVALKTLSRIEAAGIYRLKNEFRALADVSHPNLVRLHELFADDALWFFTMDLVDGERFDAWVRPNGALHKARLGAALPELLHAVLAIHDAGKLHRDLKPSNVLVTQDGRVVVLDFGLAVDPEPGGVGQTVADDSVSGTPAYMAPEQAAGRAATAASDLYALGVMLFEALTGKLPFDGRAGEMLAAKQTRAAPSALQSCPDAPPDLAAISAALLTLEPSGRPGAAALLEQLDARPTPSAAAGARPSHTPHAAPELVGREVELAALHAAYAAARDGDKPVIMLLSGESGIGKSALLASFLDTLREQGRAVVLTGRCYERESVPFKGFDALIDELSRYLRKLSAIEATALVPRDAYALRQLFPVLGRIDAIAQAPERVAPDPFELRRRGFLALGELLGRIHDRRPLVLAIDDMQWSDLDSTTLFLQLVRQADAPRMLLVASHRSEGMHENPVLKPIYETLEGETRIDLRRLALGPLPESAAASLVPGELHDRRALLAEAAGNPFLLRELSVAGETATGRSIAEILRARVLALPRDERALLEVLAVAARPLSRELAAEAAQVHERAGTAFDALRVARLARSSAEPRSLECYHDKVRESVAAGLGVEDLRRHHAALAAALVRTNDAHPEYLAEHFEHAGEAQLAAEHAARAADHALRAFAFDQAVRLYRKALSLGSFEVADSQRLQVALADALFRGGYCAEAAEAYLDASRGADPPRVAKLRSKAAAAYFDSALVARGRELVAEALRPFGLSLPRSPSAAARALGLEHARLRRRGLRLAAAQPDSARHAELAALFRLVQPQTDPLYSAALNVHVLRAALDAGDALVALSALIMEVNIRIFGVGDSSEVPELMQRARTLAASLNASPQVEIFLSALSGAYEYRGRPDGVFETALGHYDQFFTATRANPSELHLGTVMERAQILALLGRFTDVARELPAWLDESWERQLFYNICGYTMTPNLAWIALGKHSEAARSLERATRAWSALGNPYTIQDVSLQFGDALVRHAAGDARAAWTHFLDNDARFRASFARYTFPGSALASMRASTAATLAAETADSAEREQLLREAGRVPRSTSKEMRGWFLLPRVAAACACRDDDRAVSLLRELDAGPRPPMFGPIYVHATRRRLGVLLGGDEGKALVTEADAFLRAGGTVEPERVVAALTPGCEIR